MFLPAEAEELLIHQHHTTVLPTCSMRILIFFVHVMLSCMKVLVKLLVQHLIVDEDLALPQLCIYCEFMDLFSVIELQEFQMQCFKQPNQYQ